MVDRDSEAAAALRFSGIQQLKELFNSESKYLEGHEIKQEPEANSYDSEETQTSPVSSLRSNASTQPSRQPSSMQSSMQSSIQPTAPWYTSQSTPIRQYPSEWPSRRSLSLGPTLDDPSIPDPSATDIDIKPALKTRYTPSQPANKSVSFSAVGPSPYSLNQPSSPVTSPPRLSRYVPTRIAPSHLPVRSQDVQTASPPPNTRKIWAGSRVLLTFGILLAYVACSWAFKEIINAYLEKLLNFGTTKDYKPWMKTFNWDILNELAEADKLDR